MYYPYPAYGTYDEASLPGSTASIYNMEASDGRSLNQSVPGAAESSVNSIPQNIPAPYLSSSCPVVDSKLKGVRDALHAEGRHQPNRDGNPEHSSLDGKNHDDGLPLLRQQFPEQPTSFTTSGSSTTSTESDEMDGFIAERTRVPSGQHQTINAIPAHIDKNRILSATPPSNMVTRQVIIILVTNSCRVTVSSKFKCYNYVQYGLWLPIICCKIKLNLYFHSTKKTVSFNMRY